MFEVITYLWLVGLTSVGVLGTMEHMALRKRIARTEATVIGLSNSVNDLKATPAETPQAATEEAA